MTFTDGSGSRLDDLLSREWLTVNHLGGYAASTIPSLNTRKYHGLLVAAMAPPVHRMVLLSRVEEVVHCDGWPTPLACNEYPGAIHPDGYQSLHAFSPDPFPRWAYQGDGWTLGKTLQLLRGQNTVVITYTLVGARKPIELELRPLLALRSIHDLMYQWNGRLEAEEKSEGHHRVPPTARTPEVFFAHDGAFENGEGVASWYFNTIYRLEQDRGYAGLEDLWCPGVIKWTLAPGETVHFVCSADPIEFERAIAAAELQTASVEASPVVDSPLRDTDHDVLLRAAEKFLVDLPAEVIGKTPGTCRVPMITKFPWSPPSVREALIALPGLLLVTGKTAIAKEMLLSLASRVRNGLIPTEFPEVGAEPVYGGADVSLWFINAVHHYLRYSGDEVTAVRLFDTIVQILRAYQFGGSTGIVADPDGLLVCRSPGRGMTWMDAKAGDWVITPRAGRAVEINALWYNAIRIAAELAEHHVAQPNRCREMYELAAKVQESFNARFWNVQTGCCYDVIDDHGSDPSIRPNQLLAVSLPYPVLAPDRHSAVLERVRRDLLTPMGLRTLAPSDHGYQGRYGGDLVSRERACHNGSVHPWLLGAYVTAQIKVFGRSPKVRDDARRLLKGCLTHLRADGLGNLPELFDGDSPHRANGATASAIATGELLRCYVEDILDLSPWSTNAAATAVAPTATPLDVAVAPKVTTKR